MPRELNELVLWEATDDDIAPYLDQARSLWSEGDTHRALDLMRALVFVAPRARMAWRCLASLHLDLGDLDVAAALDALGAIIQESAPQGGAS